MNAERKEMNAYQRRLRTSVYTWKTPELHEKRAEAEKRGDLELAASIWLEIEDRIVDEEER